MAYSRNEYLKSLNRMRSNYQNQGNPLINNEDDNGDVGNELSAFAYMNTPRQRATNVPEQASKNKNVASQAFGAVDEIASKFGVGFVGAWEGGLDLIANFIGAMGDWTGWWDSKIFTDWAKQDIGTQLAEWTKTYANFTPWGIIENISNGNYGNKEYWEDAWKGAKDIAGSGFFAQNQIGNYREDANKYYTMDDELETGFGQFLGEAGYTVGFMLPSIMTAGASGLSGVGAKALATGMMGLSAGGKGSEEALNEGATASQALGYGALTGAIEAGTEWIPFPGGNKASGVIGGKVSKRLALGIVKEMVEEGIEEVVSEGLNPLVKYITYDKNAINQYGDKDYWAGVAKAFGSGAIMGGVFSGVHRATMQHSISSKGVQVMETMQNLDEEYKDLAKKYEKGKITEAEFYDRVDKIANQMDEAKRMYEALPEKYKENFKKMLYNPDEFKKQLKELEKENGVKYTQEEINNYVKEMANQSVDAHFDYYKEKVTKYFGNNVTMADSLSETIESKSNAEEVSKFIENTFENNFTADNYVIEPVNNSDTSIVVQPFVENGETKYGQITVDKDSNSIVDVDVKSTEPNKNEYKVVKKPTPKKISGTTDKIKKPLTKTATNIVDVEKTREVKLSHENARTETTNLDQSSEQRTSASDTTLNRRKSRGLRKILKDVKSTGRSPSGLGVVKGSNNTYVENVGGKTFHNYFEDIHKSFSLGKQCVVDLHDENFYKKGKSLVRYDGKAVAFVTTDGNIVSIANGDPTIKGFSKDALSWAIKNGGVMMDCMNSKKEGAVNLPYAYSKKGFEVVSKVAYNHDIMLEDHSAEMVKAFEKEFGKSDLVFLAYTGSEKALYSSIEECQKHIDSLPYDDWETAYNKQQQAVAELKTEKVISEKMANSSKILIEAGADVNKAVKYRLEAVKEAFDTALKEVTPDNATYKLVFKDVTKSFAELNLAKASDRAKVVDNLIKRLKDTEIKAVDVFGEEKMKIRDVLTQAQEDEARSIMLSVLNGKAEPTKLAKWAKSLQLQKIKTKETARSFKLLNKIDRKVRSGATNYLSAPTDAPTELALYQKIMQDVKAPFTNADLLNLTRNIGVYYTEENFGKMLAQYEIPFNSEIPMYNEMLAESIEKGRPLTAKQIQIANDILQLIYNDLGALGKKAVDTKRAKARDAVVLAQALTTTTKDNFATSAVNIFKTFDHSVRSPIKVLSVALGENSPIVEHLREEGKNSSNAQTAKVNEWRNEVFGGLDFKINAQSRKKVTFKGRKITTAQALKILNTAQTAGDDFFKRGGSWTEGGRRVDFKVTQAELDELKKQISPEMLKWNEERVNKFFNETSKKYIKDKFRKMNHIELEMVNGDYYPTHAVGDKVADLASNVHGSINPSDWGLTFLKERVSHTDAPYNLDGNIISDVNGYILQATQWGEWAEWYRNWKVMLNSRVFGQGTTLNAIMEKNLYGWKDIVEFINRTALGIPYDNSQNLLGKIDKVVGGVFQNFQQVAMMDLFTQTKTLGSDFTGWQFFGAKYVTQGLANYYRNGAVLGEAKARKIIEQYSPTLKNRFVTSEAFSANLGKVAKSKFSKAVTSVVRTFDMHIHLKAFYMAQVQAKAEGYGDFWSDSNNKRAVRILENYSDTTQPTTSPFNVGMYRAGANGKIIKQLFGMFQSMGQNIYQGFVDVTVGWYTGIKRIGAYEKAIVEHDAKALEYAKEEQLAKERMQEAVTDKEYKKAKKEYEEAKFHREGHELSSKTIADHLAKEKAYFTAKNWFNKGSAYLFGLLGSGLILTLLAKLKKKTYGKEEWDDWNIQELTQDALYQSFVNWIPYIGTIANSIKNDSDLTIFTVDNMNTIIKSFTNIAEAIQGGDGGKITGATFNALLTLSSFFGVPASSMWKLLNGIWYNADHGSNIVFRNWLGMYSATYLRQNYKDAYEKGQYQKGYSNLEVWLYNYSVPSSKEVIDEIYRLNREGVEGVAPSAYVTKYTNENGEEVKLTASQINAFRSDYNKANEQVSNLMKLEDYKRLNDEEKGKLIKRIYSEYYNYAKFRHANGNYTGKLATLVQATNGDIDLAKYILGMQQLSIVKEDKKHTRKENVLTAINKMKGFTRQEKLLLAYLSGYSVSEKNQRSLISFLMKNGFSKKEAKTYLKINK